MTNDLKPIRRLGAQQPQQKRTRPLNNNTTGGLGRKKPTTGILGAWNPPPLSKIEDTGLTKLSLSDLILKVLYFRGDLQGHDIADIIKLPFNGIVDQVLEFLKREKMVEITSAQGFGEASYRYEILDAGMKRALEAIDRTQYAGPVKKLTDSYEGIPIPGCLFMSR